MLSDRPSYTGVAYVALTLIKVMVVVVVAFSSHARIFREGSTIPSPFAPFFFLKWKSARAHHLHFLGQHQSTVAQRAVKNVAELRVSSFSSAIVGKKYPS